MSRREERTSDDQPKKGENWVWLTIALVVGSILVVAVINITARNAIDDTADDIGDMFDEISSEL